MSVPTLICTVLGGSLAVLRIFLAFWKADSAMCVALLANIRNESKKGLAIFCLQRVPRTRIKPSTNLTKLQNSDPKSTINLHKIIKKSFGFNSRRRLVPESPINVEGRCFFELVDATWSIWVAIVMLASGSNHLKTRYWQNQAAGGRCSAWKISKVKQKEPIGTKTVSKVIQRATKMHQLINLELWRETNDCQTAVLEHPFCCHLVDFVCHFGAQ